METPDTGDSGDSGSADTSAPYTPVWDDPAATLACDEGGEAPLLEAALDNADLPREDLGFESSLWASWARMDYVRGPFQMPWFEDAHHEPEHAACFARQTSADFDAAALALHPVAAAIGAQATASGIELAGEPIPTLGTPLSEALADLVKAAGGGDDPERADELPADLAAALVPIIHGLTAGIDARHAMDESSADITKPQRMFQGAPGLVTTDVGYLPDVTDADAVDLFAEWYMGEQGPRQLLLPARQIAFAIEDAGLEAFAGGDTDWEFVTEAGILRIAPASDDTHTVEDNAVLFQLDLGGNDTYVDGAGANFNDENPVAVSVDLGGDDHYGYLEEPEDHDAEGTLVSDSDGRENSAGYWISHSGTGRQGSGRYGIGMVFDLGAGTDTWASLRMSQGFGTLGVGVLRDDGGNDTYAAEAGAQGSGVFGWGLLLDGGGDDTYTAWAYSQGFGYVGGVGTLHDNAGNDDYFANPGNSFAGVTLYASPQLPGGEGNSSFCQGAGFGLRGDSWGQYFSGGFGVLRDVEGDDSYQTGVFGQGTGYWEGTGLLADGAGNDQYDALYYMQAGVAHYAMGLFIEGGGDDAYNQRFDSYYMHTGAGHDYSLGLFVDESGDDTYGFGGLAVGASNCQGVGIFVDKDGTDIYMARSTYSTGLGNHSGECEGRASEPSIGIFMDGGGDVDDYQWPEDPTRLPANDSTFGINWNGTDDEHGGAVDGDGATGF